MLYNYYICLYTNLKNGKEITVGEKTHSKKRKILTALLIFVLAAAIGTGAFFLIRHFINEAERKKAYDVTTLSDRQIKDVADNKKAKKLMIVAHPDDDVIWGGGHLMDGDYFVVCITNGRNDTRKPEFEKMLEKSGNSGYILEYPDKVAGERDDWTNVWDKIESDIERIMKCKDWDLIVTHNKDGEYGHQHHKYTHSIVTEIYDKNSLKTVLFNFGVYYSKAKLPDHEDKMTKMYDKQIEFKNELVKVYESQESTVNKLWHMGPYEMWTEYEQYSENPQYKK